MSSRAFGSLIAFLCLIASPSALAGYNVRLNTIQASVVYSDGSPFQGALEVQQAEQVYRQVCSGGGCLPLWQWVISERRDPVEFELDEQGSALLPALHLSAILARDPEVLVGIRYLELPEYGLKCDLLMSSQPFAADFNPPLPTEYVGSPGWFNVSQDWATAPTAIRFILPLTRAQAADYFKANPVGCE